MCTRHKQCGIMGVSRVSVFCVTRLGKTTSHSTKPSKNDGKLLVNCTAHGSLIFTALGGTPAAKTYTVGATPISITVEAETGYVH